MARSWEHRWKLGERLGKGGQGITSEATFIGEPVTVGRVKGALKFLKNNKSEQARGRMRSEVINLQVLASAGGLVPQVLDHNTDLYEDPSTELYVVMSLIPGPTLTEYVEEHAPLDAEQAIQFSLSLCKTIQIAHEFPILHRDLKPDNIIVRNASNGELCIIDYGLSFNSEDAGNTKPGETFSNGFVDLPETNTPEGDLRDHRSDVTAVCAVLYYCLTGRVLGQLQDHNGKLPHKRKGCPLQENLDADFATRLEAFFDRGLATNISNRYQSVGELITKLHELNPSLDEVDESDPLQLAASLSQQLRARDRTTQLADFRKHAEKLFAVILREQDKYKEKLGRFSIAISGGGFGRGGAEIGSHVALPAGLELVCCAQHGVKLKAENHVHECQLSFAVGARGEECVLLFLEFSSDDLSSSSGVFGRPQKIVTSSVEWKEIAWFEGDPESIHSLLSVAFSDWLKSSLKELRSKILVEQNDQVTDTHS